jgi:hypothetical protein
MGILWRHSNFNLVKPHSVAPAAALNFRQKGLEVQFRLAPGCRGRNSRRDQGCNKRLQLAGKVPVNHKRVIDAGKRVVSRRWTKAQK